MSTKPSNLFVSFCRRHPAIASVIAVAVMLLIPAALTPFNTKGEPREAIVALSMLMSGDWILPLSFGTDIPYKPPFLAWMIAVFSLPTGHVTEFTSRLPSILACMTLAATVVSFVRKDLGWNAKRALCAAIITVTTVEVWRAAGVCRVDMVLTAALTGAVVVLYRLASQVDYKRFILAAVLMTVAVLTKGPVGMVLPCLIIAIWAITARLGVRRFWRFAGIVSTAAILSLLLPLWWYYEAYSRGGEEFLQLVIEENVGRMSGSMSYASHENPWWYNIQTLIAGMLPYTLIAVFALVALSRFRLRRGKLLSQSAKLAICAAVVTLVFYTIPTSKRSVYLLPMYPFLSIGILRLWEKLLAVIPKLGSIYRNIIRWIGISAAVALCIAPFQPWAGGMSGWICLPFAVIIGAISLRLYNRFHLIPSTLILTVAIYTSLGIAVMPAIMEAKTDHDLAVAVSEMVPVDETIWEYITQDPLLRYYTAGFYLNDRIRQLPDSIKSCNGWLITSPEDAEAISALHPDIELTEIWSKRRSCDTRRPVVLYHLTPAK